MEYRVIGSTGVYVSRLAYGASNFGGGDHPLYKLLGGIDENVGARIIGTLLDNGVNLIDTADIYANGEAETILGKSLGKRRHEAVLSTKVNNRTGPGVNEVGQSRIHLMQAVDDSLRRLNTDYIDLYYIHLFDPLTRFEDSLRSFDDMIRQGKVRYIGCSNVAAWQIMKSLGVAAMKHLEPFISVQAYYSLAGRDIERELVPLAQDQNLAIVVWGALAGGFLTGKFTRDSDPSDNSRRLKFSFPPIKLDRAYDIVDTAKAVADRHNATVAQVSLAWLLHKSYITSVLFGARSVEQIAENLKATELRLSEEDMTVLDEVSKLEVEYPQWQIDLPLGRHPGGKRDWGDALK